VKPGDRVEHTADHAPSVQAVDMFAGGARGWDIHDHEFGLTTAGYEYDATACATSAAAGFVTVRGDIRKLDPPPGAVGGKGSPPCQTFSASGNGSGRRQLDAVFTAMDQLWSTGRLDYDHFEDERTGLVLEPLRWAMLSNWRWLVLEQVPPVLPVWERMAKYLEQMGFSTWTGNLHSEQYGVPQTRKRAILIASRDREVGMPAPTHSKYHNRTPEKLDPGVRKWVSMAEALGRGLTSRPSPTITGGGSETGGAEPINHLARYMSSPDWVYRNGNQDHGAERPLAAPTPTVHFGARQNDVRWVQRSNYSAPGKPGQTAEERGLGVRPLDHPSFGVTSKAAHWVSETKDFRVTVQEAAVLQSLPADHPWQGNKGQQYLQVGNAIPALMARAILREVL